MNRALAVFVAAVAATTLNGAALGQAGHDHSSMMQKAAQPPKPATAEGEVRKVDLAKGTVTLKHGPLEALKMPPMTMAFVAKDPKMLASLKEGDKVRFTPEQSKDGTLTVTQIEVVK